MRSHVCSSCAALFVALSWCAPARAAEYFVSPRGADRRAGRSAVEAFRTVKKGVSALKPGDTLTILPGDYMESLRVRLSGEKGKPITIRAQRRGTVLLRGDVAVDGFERVAGLHYTWAKRFDRPVEGVGERDTAAIYAFVPSAVEVEEVRGACCYDVKARMLYVHTSDSRRPDRHALVASVTNDFGMLFEPPAGQKHVTDIVVDGIGFSGYMNREAATRPGGLTRWGLYFVLPERCVVRRCTAFLNGGGIGYVRPVDCLIEDCRAFGNFSTYSSSGGNIISWSPATRTVHRNNVVHSTASNGIRFYGGGTQQCVMQGNLAYDCGYGEIWVKGGANATTRMLGNISLGSLHPLGLDAANIRGNICKYGSGQERFDASNVILSRLGRSKPADLFVDPAHYDYRLQADSKLRRRGPNGRDPGPFPYRDEVFFVGPTGHDRNPGTCVNRAWRTLGHAAAAALPGHTVYILPGAYAGPLAPARSGTSDKPIVFRRRGHGRVQVKGTAGVKLDGLSHVRVIGLDVEGAVSADRTSGVCVERSTIAGGVAARDATGLAIRHCAIDGGQTGLSLENGSGVEIVANVFGPSVKTCMVLDHVALPGLYSDFNCFGRGACVARVDGKAFGGIDRWRRASMQDSRSLVSDGTPRRLGRGPLATHIGPIECVKAQAPVKLDRVRVHSVSATTANIEWWTPTAEATTTLHWGLTPDCPNKVENVYDGCIFHTVSLVGLRPGARYHFRVSATKPVWEFHTNEALAELEQRKARSVSKSDVASFTTLAKDAPARTFHVSARGDDSNDGLAKARAWRTLRHAAASVRAGDTVLIHAGAYEEHVPVRVTGDRGRPVTFRAAGDGKVWLNGSAQKRCCAVRLAFKHHVVLDGLYFHHFRSKPYNSSSEGGAVHVVGGSHNVARRCFYDGRTKTYMPFFILGQDTSDFTMENCVVIMGWNNVSFWRCPNLLLRHNVFYNGQIRALTLFNDADQPVTLSHNLICANIPQKVRNPQISLWHLESYRGDHNGYFSRQSEQERAVAAYVRVKGEKNPGRLLLAELRQRTGQDRYTIFANPGIPVVKQMQLTYKPGEYERLELHRKGMQIEPLDFRDFMGASNGSCARAADGEPIGLDPAAFSGVRRQVSGPRPL